MVAAPNITQFQDMSVMQAQASLYSKMAKIMNELSRLEKHGENKFHNYAYATESDVADAIRPLLAKNNVAFFPSMVECKQEWYDKPNGKKGCKTQIRFLMTFACGDTGATFTQEWYAESEDTEDKGMNKAATAAVKYFLLKTFVMSTGDDDDPDSDGTQPRQEQKRSTSPQQQRSTPPAQQQRPQNAPPAQNGKPLFATADEAKAFVARMAEKHSGLTESQVKEALNVKGFSQYTGAMQDAEKAIATFVSKALSKIDF